MEQVHSFTSNQLDNSNVIPVKKENRQGKYKNLFYHQEYYHNNKDKISQQRKVRYLKKVGGKLKYNKSVEEHSKEWKYINWDKVFNRVLDWGHNKDASDVKKCSCVKYNEKTIGELGYKKYLKVLHNWHLSRRKKREYLKAIKYSQAGVCLGIKKSYYDYKIGCIDIDNSPGHTCLFKTMYVSNRIGSVHFYFLYKENDLGKENDKIIINGFKADLKMCQYMMAPLSLHHSGSLYRIRGSGSFFIGKFEKVSEVKQLLEKKVKRLQEQRLMKKEQKQLQAQIIQISYDNRN